MKKSITSRTYILSLMYLFCGVMVFLLTFSVNTLYVSAEGSDSLPYYVDSDNFVNHDGYTISDLQNFYNGRWGTAYPLDFTSTGTIIYESSSGSDPVYYFTYVLVPESNFSYSVTLSEAYSSFDTSTDYASIRFNNYRIITFSFYRNKYNDPGLDTLNGSVNFLGSYYQPVYVIGSYDYLNDSSQPVISQYQPPVVVTGHATPPINNTGHYIPNPHPNKPVPSTYTPPSPQFPSVDTSTLESLVESLIDVVKYGFSYTGSVVSGWFNNLISNVSDYLDYIGDLLVYGFNNVVGSIQDFATDFYNNMVSLIEPVFEFFSGVSNFFNTLVQLGMVNGSFEIGEFLHNLIVPSTSDVLDLLMDNDSVGSHHLYLATYHKVSDIITTFTNLQPIKVFTVPSTTWHGYTIGGFTVDFSWYDDYKTYMDIILSGFLVIGYLYWIYLQLNSLFRGTGSVVYDSLYETPTKGGDSH